MHRVFALAVIFALAVAALAGLVALRQPDLDEPSRGSTFPAPAHPDFQPVAAMPADAGSARNDDVEARPAAWLADASSTHGSALEQDLGPADSGVAGDAEVDAGAADGGAAPDASLAPARFPLSEAGEQAELTGSRSAPDPRFFVAWDQPANCPDGSGADTLARRSTLLATFALSRVSLWPLAHDRSVGPDRLRQVGEALTRAQLEARTVLGPGVDGVAVPSVYVYRDVAQLQSVSCAPHSARGYYDGAIHVAAENDVVEAAMHEHVHHVLRAFGIQTPTWLHEGLAMLLAGEQWWRDPRLGLVEWIAHDHLPFAAMTEASPHTADAQFAIAASFQSLLMVRFIRARHGDAGLRQLVTALAAGQLAPRDAFAAAAGLDGSALERAWGDFVLLPPEEW